MSDTVEFIRQVTRLWIAQKVLAAGAIHPRDGFKHAFEAGADFACVGTPDFQASKTFLITKNISARQDTLKSPAT